MSKKTVTDASTETVHEETAMPTKTKKTNHRASAETNHQEKTAMPTKTASHPHHATTTTHPKETTLMPSSIEAAPLPIHPSIAAVPAVGVGAGAPAPAPSPSVGPPPASANIPATPAGFTPATPGEFRSVVPRKSELAAMPQALIDLSKFIDFDKMFSGIGLTQTEITQVLATGNDWSTMRVATTQWDLYCILQEGYSWRAIRAALLRLEQAFVLAAQANPSLVTLYPGLSSLLGAKKSIAQKGASTRRLNKAAKAKGEPEIHGVVGKQRQRRAQKAALANGSPATPAAPAPTAGTVAQATPAAPVVTAPPVGPAPMNGGSSGVAH